MDFWASIKTLNFEVFSTFVLKLKKLLATHIALSVPQTSDRTTHREERFLEKINAEWKQANLISKHAASQT